MKQLNLICNAHLDPVWLWNWDDGIATALSTFRAAADFCEEYEGFVFNHNEVILYEWVEQYEPELFSRIQALVKAGKWHIMGGWYLQPDCNMPSGESIVRQTETGRKYFAEKFGQEPTTAINFDPFGHSRGLVQILKKTGYDSYVFCRPNQLDCELPEDDFIWVGFDGSKVMAHRSSEHYNSQMGEAKDKVQKWLDDNKDRENGILLWGVGNHGGGPSRIDLNDIAGMMENNTDRKIVHSTPEQFFQWQRETDYPYREVAKDLNSWAVGCYTSQIRIKQRHRKLENELFLVEKMCSAAAMRGLMEYPSASFAEAQKDLLTAEFHDILPGSAIAAVEESGLQMMAHGLQILSNLKVSAFFKLALGQRSAEDGEYPILIYNPHPYTVRGNYECEFQLKNQNWGSEFSMPTVYQDGKPLPTQLEKESCNINLDWIKRVCFTAELKPFSMNRFDVRIEMVKEKISSSGEVKEPVLAFETDDLMVRINSQTGLMDSLMIDGKEYLKRPAFRPVVLESDNDPWAGRMNRFDKELGCFELLDSKAAMRYAGTDREISSVRVIEDGSVRTVVEAVFGYGDSFLTLHYKLPKCGRKIELSVTVHWAEKGKILKLECPTVMTSGTAMGETIFGVQEFTADGREMVSQRWNGVFDKSCDMALTFINDGIYGSDYKNGTLRLTLLQSAAYSGFPIEGKPLIQNDRVISRIDQGEREFHFLFEGGSYNERETMIGQEALVYNQKPYAVAFFPSGANAGKEKEGLSIDRPEILLSAWKQTEQPGHYMLRLFNSVNHEAAACVELLELSMKQEFTFGAFEVKTIRLSADDGSMEECGMLE